MKGKGVNLLTPPLPLGLPVTAQLVNDSNSVCFESIYTTGAVVKNDANTFKATMR
jgi:hypothetical protein